ncbi:hypothetical protein [Pleionea sp. CnH1-48]|uniref:hypothetical protein n=1 Tax=Pleionea sp. CnH1-48 TaxID=2954494 RepID=UPI00209863B9|nr:hypothetical protein [Pleionea sp. CnH1-48]MCO7225067.1 hypothetical protein [Pleionea sp. CnH1-48]
MFRRYLVVITLSLFSCSTAFGAEWNVSTFYQLKEKTKQGKFDYEYMFSVYFQGIFDSLRMVEKHNKLNGMKDVFCFPDGKSPSSKELFELVQADIETMKITQSHSDYLKMPLVTIATNVLAESYSCPPAEVEVQQEDVVI